MKPTDRFQITDAEGYLLALSDSLLEACDFARHWRHIVPLNIEVWVIDSVHNWTLFRY